MSRKVFFHRASWLPGWLIGLLLAPVLGALEPVSDEELAAVHGMEGIQLTLRLRNNLDAEGNPMGCTGLLNPCRMGLEFSGREGIWLMLKDYYGQIEINDIRLEGALLPTANTGFFDAGRFRGLSGECLVDDCNPAGGAAVRIFYPTDRAAGRYDDMHLLMNIGRTALEFDDGGDPMVPGYMRDQAGGSVLGFRMADSSALNAPSRARFDGEAYVFGF